MASYGYSLGALVIYRAFTKEEAMQNPYALLGLIAEDEGYEDADELVFAVALDSVQPGICLDCHTVAYSCEPDACNNYCEECGANAVQAVAVLAGVV